jgi:hypothetical protein
MKKTTSIFVAIAFAGISAQAQSIISWAYDNGNPIPPTGFAGVVSVNNWNLAGAGGSANLSYNDASLSGTTLSLAGGFGNWGIGGVSAPDDDGTYNKAIFDGYYNSLGSTLTLGNISYSTYDVYVYFSSDVDGRTGTVSDGTKTFSFSTMGVAATSGANALFSQTTDIGAGNPSANYAIFSALTGGAQTFTIANTSDGMGFAGIQIVAVPEPSVLALAALGGFGLCAWRRRPQKA